MRNLFSPYFLGRFHWICLAVAYIGWSAVMTGTCPGLRNCTASLTLFITCRTVATECAWSRRRGIRAEIHDSKAGPLFLSAWWDDHIKFTDSISSVIDSFWSHSYSNEIYALKLSRSGTTVFHLRRGKIPVDKLCSLDIDITVWKFWNSFPCITFQFKFFSFFPLIIMCWLLKQWYTSTMKRCCWSLTKRGCGLYCQLQRW